ncbi:hypothetical protein SDC9_151830 [bioreactor metagenome]|uniref:Uncharacterized protein n=1 Tax=bioreactor metagenome TaxID=1076179 RepID=A0A645ETS1_9ZZZZ
MEELFRTEPGSTVVYGPLLLARSKFLGNTEEEMLGPSLPAGFECTVRPIESDTVAHAFEAELRSGGNVLHTKVCDYASAGNEITGETKLFSIFF